MAKSRILLDTNVYLRIADSFHPLLRTSFGEKPYTLYVIPDFQKEFNRSPRLTNKFGWVNQPEYIANRKMGLRISKAEKEQIKNAYSFLWRGNIDTAGTASRVDVRALAYGVILGIPVVTDDAGMRDLAHVYGITVWGLSDLLKLMLRENRIGTGEIITLIEYLEYNNDLPYPGFENDIKQTLQP